MKNYELTVFSNEPIYLDGIPMHSPTIREISKITEQTYRMYIGISTITKEKLDNADIDMNNYQILTNILLSDKDNLLLFLDALFFWTKKVFQVDTADGKNIYFFYEDVLYDDVTFKYEINESNYDRFVEIINFINYVKVEEKKPKSKVVMEIEEKIRIAKEKINKKLNKKDDELTLFDLVSVLAANGNGLNALNVVDMNIFTFHDQFKRMQIIEDYDIQIKSVLAGAEIKDIKHYIRKI